MKHIKSAIVTLSVIFLVTVIVACGDNSSVAPALEDVEDVNAPATVDADTQASSTSSSSSQYEGGTQAGNPPTTPTPTIPQLICGQMSQTESFSDLLDNQVEVPAQQATNDTAVITVEATEKSEGQDGAVITTTADGQGFWSLQLPQDPGFVWQITFSKDGRNMGALAVKRDTEIQQTFQLIENSDQSVFDLGEIKCSVYFGTVSSSGGPFPDPPPSYDKEGTRFCYPENTDIFHADGTDGVDLTEGGTVSMP